jgi:catechol 2,3-dioxygenase
MAINVQKVGHVVLKVRDVEKSAAFYRDVIGLREVARGEFSATGENHHDLALAEVGRDAPDAPPEAVGLYHVALKIGDSLETLRAAREHLEAHGVTRLRIIDHRVSQSIYLNDPDGHGIELYVDADPKVWKDDPRSVANAVPLTL